MQAALSMCQMTWMFLEAAEYEVHAIVCFSKTKLLTGTLTVESQ